MDGAIWIQHLPWEPDENAELFVKGVELIDKYAPTGKAKKVYAMVKSLAKRHNKASMEYCGMLNFFFALGRWNGEKKPQDHIKDCMWAYKDYVNA